MTDSHDSSELLSAGIQQQPVSDSTWSADSINI